MSIHLQIEETPDYLNAKFTGAGTPEEVWRQFRLIAEHCKRAHKNKLLLDWTEVHGEASIVDRYLLGEESRIFAEYNLKVATADRREQADSKRFGEMVALNRWVNVRAFSNIEDAQEWLLQ